MSVGGYGQGGSSGAGPSKMFLSLPWKGWREVGTWLEEFVDACGYRFDVLKSKFISASARAKLLDPTITPVDSPSTYLATATAPALNSPSSDTLLDVLGFIALGIYPVDSNLSVSQKQALVQVGWDALKRKGTRQQLLNLVSQILDGVVVGWTVPSFNFGMIIADGTPAPGYGNWVQANNTTAEAIRPWVLDAGRQIVSPETPAWGQLGFGFSQFRAGYSSVGETIYPSGARIGILPNSSFTNWTAGVPDNWTKAGTGTLTQSTSAPYINWEFTGNAARIDLSAAAAGVSVSLAQTTIAVNNQLEHRVSVDYAYTNSQNVGVLCLQITDVNADGRTYYWNGQTATWSTSVVNNVLSPSSTRTSYGTNVTLQANSSSARTFGTAAITVKVLATSDGTATTKTTYDIYRVDVFERFSLAQELTAGGERTFWAPLIDALGWTTNTRGVGAVIVEPANYNRSAYKLRTNTAQEFPYHPALTGRAMRASSGWTNQLAGSNDFVSDWSTSGCDQVASTISPIVGETVASATTYAADGSATSQLFQATSLVPTNKSVSAGLWVKKLADDNDFTQVTVGLLSNSTKSVTFTVRQSDGWKLLALPAQTFGGGDVTPLSFFVEWSSVSMVGALAFASSYLYDVTGKSEVLYPPVCITPTGSTSTLSATQIVATTASTGTNVLHPLIQRTMVSAIKGALTLTIVPTFDAASQPNGVIFDVAKDATHDRVKLHVSSGTLKLSRWDDGAHLWEASLTLTKSPNPATGSMTWLRDTAITIRCVWNDQSTQLSAGNGNAVGAKPGSWATPVDAGVVGIGIGNDFSKANQFDGLVRIDPGVIQLGDLTF